MVDDSVDDMYYGCSEAMMESVKQDKFKEMTRGKFAEKWRVSKDCVKKMENQIKPKALTQEHLKALCIYTGNEIYGEFNRAVRTSRSSYGSSFKFHTLHFWLTSALQILNDNCSCQITYRRTHDTFVGDKYQTFRFGSFASTSTLTNLTNFGKETCFKIKTCYGASVQEFSVIRPNEMEVLIPPYEMFEIKEIIKGEDKVKKHFKVQSCKLMYVVESAGIKSNLNCKAVPKVPMVLHSSG